MRKLGIIAVTLGAAAAAAFVAATAYSGNQVQKALLAQPRQWARALPFVEVHELKYEKGFASATRTTTLKLGCPGHAPVMLTWRDTISHGPLPGGTAFGAALIESELVLGRNAPPLTARTVVDFAGGTKTELAVARFAAELPHGKVAWQDLKLNWQVPAKGAASYALELPAFEFDDSTRGVSLKLTGLHVRGETLPGLSWSAAGSGTGELAALDVRVQAPGAAVFEAGLRKVTLANGARVDASGLLHATSSLGGEARFGGAKVDRFELQGSIKRVHAASYEALLAGLTAASCDPHALQRDSAALQSALLEMLPHNPEIALDRLAVSYAGRQAVLSYGAAVDGVTRAELKGALAPVLMNKATLRFDLQVPTAWLDQALPAMAPAHSAAQPSLDGLVQQGLLQRDGDTLSASLRFAQGTLSVNGRAMPLPQPR